MSAEKRDQIDKKFFFEIINVLDQMIKSTSILLKNFFLKKNSIWSLFPALTPTNRPIFPSPLLERRKETFERFLKKNKKINLIKKRSHEFDIWIIKYLQKRLDLI